MPLQTSPVSGEPMRRVHKLGVEIDVCPTSGGVWLDRSELEKIVSMVREQEHDARSNQLLDEWSSRSPQSSRSPRYDDDYSEKRHRGHKRRSKLSDLFDVFD